MGCEEGWGLLGNGGSGSLCPAKEEEGAMSGDRIRELGPEKYCPHWDD